MTTELFNIPDIQSIKSKLLSVSTTPGNEAQAAALLNALNPGSGEYILQKGFGLSKIQKYYVTEVNNSLKNLAENAAKVANANEELKKLSGETPGYATGDEGQIAEATRMGQAGMQGLTRVFNALPAEFKPGTFTDRSQEQILGLQPATTQTAQTITPKTVAELQDLQKRVNAGENIVIGGQPTQPDSTTTTGQAKLADLPASAQAVLDTVQEQLVNNVINPDVEISDELVQQFLEQAKQETDPYFKQLFNQAEQDLRTGNQWIGEDLASSEQKLQQDYGDQLKGIQENAASRGLTFSSARQNKERDLVSRTNQAIEQGRKLAERSAYDLGTAAERTIGSSAFPTDLSGVNEAPKPILNQPGIFAFDKPATTRSLFTPTGNTTGTLQQQQLEANKSRQLDLTNAERELRGIYTK